MKERLESTIINAEEKGKEIKTISENMKNEEQR